MAIDATKFDFITSPRFWQLFAVGLAAGLNEYSNSQDWAKALYIAIGIWLGGAAVVRTIDRATEVLSSKKLPQ